MAIVETGNCCAGECFKVVQNVASWLTDGPKHLFDDVDATADLLRLVQRVQLLFEPIVQFPPLKRIAVAVIAITEFVDARNFMNEISAFVQGKAAWEAPFSKHVPDLLKIASKLAFLVGDLTQLTYWLSSIHVLEAWVKESTACIVTWGREFNILQGIGDAACITGALLSLGDTIRLIVQEAVTGGYFKDGLVQWSPLTNRLLDVAYDVSSIAASILSNIPGVPAILSVFSLTVGTTISLGRFFKKTYLQETDI